MKRSLGIHSDWELGLLYMSSWVFDSWGRTDGWTKWIYKKMGISDKSKTFVTVTVKVSPGTTVSFLWLRNPYDSRSW